MGGCHNKFQGTMYYVVEVVTVDSCMRGMLPNDGSLLYAGRDVKLYRKLCRIDNRVHANRAFCKFSRIVGEWRLHLGIKGHVTIVGSFDDIFEAIDLCKVRKVD